MSQPVDDLALNALNLLKKPGVSSESKLAQLNSLKSSIKHQRIPENALAATIECVRLAIASQTSPSLVAAGFSSLTHLVKRLALQEQLGLLFSQRANLTTALLERLGDAKESHRAAALQAFCDIWPGKQVEAEKVIRDGALVSGNSRAKLAAMQWVTKMHEEQNLQFRSFVPLLVGCLEDADGTVREGAKTNLVELFRGARDSAKADLKKQLLVHNVRKSISTFILSSLGIPVPSETGLNSSSHSGHRPETHHADHGSVDGAAQEPSLPPSVEAVEIEPLYVYTARELEDIFRQMTPCFEDREKEDNWKARDNNVLKLRRLLKGNASTDHLTIFVAGIKTLLDGILKVVHSLRTTLSSNGCQFFQELARTLGPAIDSMAEIILTSLDKMCSATKHIAAQNGNVTIDTVLSHVSYNVRHMQHIWAATGDKNVQPRSFACGWLQTVLRRVSHQKSHFEHTGGLDLADKSIRKGLSDANPKVRETMRATYWLFAEAWPDRAEAIIASLDAKSKQLLEQHSGNPNASGTSSAFTRSVGPDAANNPRLAASNSRASLKEHIAAQKKAALASKRMPDRPNSAMSSFTPVREAPSSARRGAPTLTNHSHNRVTSASSQQSSQQSSSRQISSSSQTHSSGQGSLMSAPMRRPRRPEAPRPATADPYANRKLATPPTSPKGPAVSGSHTKSKSTTTAAVARPSDSGQSSRGASPRTSPIKPKQRPMHHPPNLKDNSTRDGRLPDGPVSPLLRHEYVAATLPEFEGNQITSTVPLQMKSETDRPNSSHSSVLDTVEEDNFTLVIPEKSQIYGLKASGITQDREIVPLKTEERNDDPVIVYEDPDAADQTPVAQVTENAPQPVLEEVPASEQNLQVQFTEITPELHLAITDDQERPMSPKKATTPVTVSDSLMQDRAEVLRTRRLLASGIERIRAGILDAHGFRRLQDLVKSNANNLDVRFAPLLSTLSEYLTTPNESLKTTPPKAQALKSQALSASRAVLSLYRRDEAIKELVPSTLCAFIESTKNCESSVSHSYVELEKAISELIKVVQVDLTQIAKSISTVAQITEHESEFSSTVDKEMRQACARQLSTALGTLSILVSLDPTLSSPDSRETINGDEDGVQRRQRLVRLVVKCLSHGYPEVRRKAIEFAVEMHRCFSTKAEQHAEANGNDSDAMSEMVKGKEEFWKLLRGAGEQQCNLVAYYLARKERAEQTF